MKLKSYIIVPIARLISMQTEQFISEVRQGFSEKLAAVIVLLAAVLFAYIVALGCGVLIAVLLLTLTNIRLFYAVLIVIMYMILLVLVSFIIGKNIMSKSVSEDRRNMDIFKWPKKRKT